LLILCIKSDGRKDRLTDIATKAHGLEVAVIESRVHTIAKVHEARASFAHLLLDPVQLRVGNNLLLRIAVLTVLTVSLCRLCRRLLCQELIIKCHGSARKVRQGVLKGLEKFTICLLEVVGQPDQVRQGLSNGAWEPA
jgi:hypothetical protein